MKLPPLTSRNRGEEDLSPDMNDDQAHFHILPNAPKIAYLLTKLLVNMIHSHTDYDIMILLYHTVVRWLLGSSTRSQFGMIHVVLDWRNLENLFVSHVTTSLPDMWSNQIVRWTGWSMSTL